MLTQITPQDYAGQYQPKILKILSEIKNDLREIGQETHPGSVKFLEVADATRLRLLAVAEIQYQLAIQSAKHTLDFQKQQIQNDYELARDDIREKMYSEIRRKKKELREILNRLQQQGIQCQAEIKQCNEISVPSTRKERKVQPPTFFNFKLNENEAKQDLMIIRNLSEQISK